MLEHYYADNTKFGGEQWFNFGRLYHQMVSAAPSDRPSTFVEIGCWKGRSTAYLGVEIINSGKPISLYVVDTFKGSAEHRGFDTSKLYDTFMANLQPVMKVLGDRFRLYHMTSLEAAARFKKPRFDFVFLDGSHETQDVVDDIKAWLPKVKPGGVLGGDDFKMPAVRIAVEYVLGKGRVQVPHGVLWPHWCYYKPKE